MMKKMGFLPSSPKQIRIDYNKENNNVFKRMINPDDKYKRLIQSAYDRGQERKQDITK